MSLVMTSRQIIILATFISCGVLLSPWPPLGVPGEWVWPRHALPLDIFEMLDRIIWPLLCGSAIVVYCTGSMRLIGNAGIVRRGLLLFGLTGLSFLWLSAVRQAAPSPHRELRPTWILYDKYASGYFYNATFKVTSTKQMLSDYEARMAEGDVLHEGTHPPGLLLLNRSLLKLTDAFPAVVEFSESLQNAETVRMFREVEAAGQMARPLSKSELAALHLSSILSALFVAMTVIPVFGLTQRITDSRIAWRAASLMITVPTIGVFVPRSDVLYACSGMILAWVVVCAFLTEGRGWRWILAVLAGVALCGCLLISLAHLPVLVMLAIFVCGFTIVDLRRRMLPILETTTITALSFFATCAVWQYMTQCSLLHVWQLNLGNHAAFYSQSPRSWSAWFAVNPIELAMAVGLPVAVISIVGIYQLVTVSKASRGRRFNNGQMFTIACVLTWTLLWLSGKNMGEAARLWCFATPWFAIIAAQTRGSDTAETNKTWLWLLIAQLIVATITVGRVSGFLEF